MFLFYPCGGAFLKLYEGGFFKAKLEFPKDFPNNPPTMTFVSEMFHPNGESPLWKLSMF